MPEDFILNSLTALHPKVTVRNVFPCGPAKQCTHSSASAVPLSLSSMVSLRKLLLYPAPLSRVKFYANSIGILAGNVNK